MIKISIYIIIEINPYIIALQNFFFKANLNIKGIIKIIIGKIIQQIRNSMLEKSHIYPTNTAAIYKQKKMLN